MAALVKHILVFLEVDVIAVLPMPESLDNINTMTKKRQIKLFGRKPDIILLIMIKVDERGPLIIVIKRQCVKIPPNNATDTETQEIVLKEFSN